MKIKIKKFIENEDIISEIISNCLASDVGEIEEVVVGEHLKIETYNNITGTFTILKIFTDGTVSSHFIDVDDVCFAEPFNVLEFYKILEKYKLLENE